MNKASNTNLIYLPLLLITLTVGLSSSIQNTEERVNFQDYCWPILGDSDTTMVYKYQMTSVEYDTLWNRYFKIEAHTNNNTRYFNYTVYDHEFIPESHYKYIVDHKGIRLEEIEVSGKENQLIPGTIQHQRIFAWDLNKGDKHTTLMNFNNLFGDSTNLSLSSMTQYEGLGRKEVYKDEKYPSIRFFRKVTRSSKDVHNTSQGVSYYAKGIGYYRSHIIYNNFMEFDEELIDILSLDEWNELRLIP